MSAANGYLRFSVETLLHYVCRCGGIWTESAKVNADGIPIMPQATACPKCKTDYTLFEDITQQFNFCGQHGIWYHVTDCPICALKDRKAYNLGYMHGLNDGPKLMELPGE